MYLGQRPTQSSGLFYGFFSTESGGLCPALLSGLQSGLRAGLYSDLPAGLLVDQPAREGTSPGDTFTKRREERDADVSPARGLP